MLPKVTLLRDQWATFSLHFGRRVFDFVGGEPVPVPVAVALELGKKSKGDGSPLFKVEGLPKIVKPAGQVPVGVAQQSMQKAPRQMFLEQSWP